mmetsp:Transcript_79493/g.219885  ORF Transcript_79493/g.219885 Transcript_79493/m.219885 type:complete len:200 (-) Transcript_79493:157-756(-)
MSSTMTGSLPERSVKNLASSPCAAAAARRLAPRLCSCPRTSRKTAPGAPKRMAFTCAISKGGTALPPRICRIASSTEAVLPVPGMPETYRTCMEPPCRTAVRRCAEMRSCSASRQGSRPWKPSGLKAATARSNCWTSSLASALPPELGTGAPLWTGAVVAATGAAILRTLGKHTPEAVSSSAEVGPTAPAPPPLRRCGL